MHTMFLIFSWSIRRQHTSIIVSKSPSAMSVTFPSTKIDCSLTQICTYRCYCYYYDYNYHYFPACLVSCETIVSVYDALFHAFLPLMLLLLLLLILLLLTVIPLLSLLSLPTFVFSTATSTITNVLITETNSVSRRATSACVLIYATRR